MTTTTTTEVLLATNTLRLLSGPGELVTLTLSAESSPVNLMTTELLDDLERALNHIGTHSAIAGVILASGRDVACDASFRSRDWRRRAVELARRHDAEPLILHLRCGEDELRRRLRRRRITRGDPSDADESLLEDFIAGYDTPRDDEGAVRTTLDTDGGDWQHSSSPNP